MLMYVNIFMLMICIKKRENSTIDTLQLDQGNILPI